MAAVVKDDVRDRITAAARKRFSHFGYAKTTMAELAADCDMSPGNLYRFFPGKLDIAEAIARTAECLRRAELERLISAPARNAHERLRDFLFAELTSTYAQLAEDPHAVDLARIIARERPSFSEERIAAERRLIERLLDDGNKAGEFTVADCAYAAEMIHSATLKFRYPQRWTVLPLSVLERELDGVFGLIMTGLLPREAARPALHSATNSG